MHLIPPRAAGRLRAVLPGRDTPVTSVLVVVLLASSAALQWGAPGDAEVREWASTNLVNLDRHPMTALFASAFVNSGWLPFQVVVFAVAASVLERTAGRLRAVVIPLIGHVVATLVTEGGVRVAIWSHNLDRSAARQLDVGISYAAMTALAAAVCTLPRRLRAAGLTAVTAWVAVPLLAHADMTRWGHALSALIGVLAWHWVRHPSHARERSAGLRAGLRPSWSGAGIAGLTVAGLVLLSVGGDWVLREPQRAAAATARPAASAQALAPAPRYRCHPVRVAPLGQGVGHRIHVPHGDWCGR